MTELTYRLIGLFVMLLPGFLLVGFLTALLPSAPLGSWVIGFGLGLVFPGAGVALGAEVAARHERGEDWP